MYQTGKKNELRVAPQETLNSVHWTRQYLYFTTDEEIKEGDWIITAYNKIVKTVKAHTILEDEKCKKIIATTDQQLRIKSTIRESYALDMNYGKVLSILPQPSKEFIKEYCESGGIDEVDEVDVELELDTSGCKAYLDHHPLDTVEYDCDELECEKLGECK